MVNRGHPNSHSLLRTGKLFWMGLAGQGKQPGVPNVEADPSPKAKFGMEALQIARNQRPASLSWHPVGSISRIPALSFLVSRGFL